ncbi:phage tail sheath C-terminal domain-containing protein [Novosphingobium sp. 9U]|uniref:phage tail sheath family protein n=1 Tax=Novosphingobium sp. 9U TaxID=2653158 RepID=UPI0012F030D2|nr:phage tail sheath C-terminal domain-containing protein [Novosphingobium sp. 9U]VWX50917.1 conserved hypothetical protein [Novosphingobium sp. 9U]
MPATLSYPGVYVEEVASGAHAITGVATSIAAFIGRTLRGPLDEPVFVNSQAEFDRTFGGLWLGSPLSFAIRDFFLNGGSQALVVRVFAAGAQDIDPVKEGADAVAKAARDAVAGAANPQAVATAATDKAATLTGKQKIAGDVVAAAATSAVAGAADADAVAKAAEAAAEEIVAATTTPAAALSANGLALRAASPGAWGNKLRVRIDHDVKGDNPDDLFNLSVRDDATGAVEVFRNVSFKPEYARRVDKVLGGGSNLVRLEGALPSARPTAHAAIPSGKTGWEDATSTKVADDAQSNDGKAVSGAQIVPPGGADAKKGLYALEKADLFNILVIPPYALDEGNDVAADVLSAAVAYCERRRAILLIDPPSTWASVKAASDGIVDAVGDVSKNAAIYFPRLLQPNPLRDGQVEIFAPAGAIAGLYARSDAERGVWKAPAGIEARLIGAPALSVSLTDLENGRLNQLGINCLRSFPAAGRIAWGARTRAGDDRLTSEWKYIPVRRTALFIEESLYRGTQWVVFEPNDESLWAQVRLNVGAFMQRLFRQGAFQGSSARDAYFVKCDAETTPQADIDLGIVNILVGFAPLKPAEFVVIRLQQITAQAEV